MIRRKLLAVIIGLVVLSNLQAQQHPCKPIALQCEYLHNPLGIDAAAPRLSWKLDDDRYGAVQTAYRVVVGKDSLAVLAGKGSTWDSEKMVDANQLVRYAGAPLESFSRYYWKVQVWDKDFQLSESDVAVFETAMMTGTDWVGDWIFDKQDVDYRPTPLFRKTFDTHGAKSIARARVYIAAGGLYELYVNGQRIGDRLLDPVFARYDRRTMYATLDVTAHLKAGSNAIGVMLGNGWYNHQSKAVWYFDNAPWRGRQRFCLDLRITYADGTEEVIATGPDWKMANSPYLFNSIYTGERYDARLEQPGWNDVGFDDGAWEDARIATAPATVIAAQQMHPIRVIDELAPISVKKINDTTHLFTFPRNIAGVSKLKIDAPRGTVFTLTHGEVLHKGRLNTYRIGNKRRESDIPDSMATDIYIAKGDRQETFHSVFNYKGFQYVEVTTSTPIDLGGGNLSALVVHSDVPPMGSVKTSNELVNGIFSATNNSYLNNLHGYPTDCPHREKNGWTADGHIAIETALFGFDGITIYEKWLQDHLDEQQPNGMLPNKIPNAGQDYEWANGADWTSSMIIIPWQIYQFYGDTKLLETTYEGMKRYMTLLERRSDGGILSWALGDWSPVKTRSDTVFISSLYYYLDASILSKTASVLGKAADEQYYGKLAEQIKRAINARFLDASSGNYAGGSQTELSAALYFGIVPDELKPKVVVNLVNKVHEANDHLDVGLLGAKTLFNALSENGYGDLALKVLSQSTFPSFGYWIANGATTLYETWPIAFERIASLNHIMFGECAAWLYKSVGGIHPDPEQPGFKNILLKPLFADSLDEAEAFHVSPFGKIVSTWKRSGEKIRYEVCIPPNSTALLHLPSVFKTVTVQGQDITKHPYIVAAGEIGSAHTYRLAAGSYVFEIQKHPTIPAHPRILLTEEQEQSTRRSIIGDPIWKKLHEALLLECENVLQQPKLTYHKTGIRLLDVSREALRRISYLAYAYRFTSDERFLKRAEDEMLTVSQFKDWNPTHFLDVAEMTLAVAIGYDWLYDGLSGDSRKRIALAIQELGLTPSLDSNNNWWLTRNHNWNQVCNAGMFFGALAVYDENTELAEPIIKRSIESIALPMDEYEPDGAYPEGYIYWDYGTSFNVLLLAGLDAWSGPALGTVECPPGFLQSASYMVHMSGPAGLPFNYGDSNETGINPAMYWYAARLNDPSLLWFERQQLNHVESLVTNRLLPVAIIWGSHTKMADVAPPKEHLWVGQGVTPVALMRSSWRGKDAVYVGFKGGSASTNHAHMDVGSFVMDAMGERWAMDLGLQEYHTLEAAGLNIWENRQHSERWNVFRYTNFVHNTVTVNDSLHRVAGYAQIDRYGNDGADSYAISDISSVFQGLLASCKRGVAIREGNHVVIRDEIVALDRPAKIRWTMLTPASASIADRHTIVLEQHGKRLVLKVHSEGGIQPTMKIWKTNPPHNYDAPNPGTTLVGFEVEIPQQHAVDLTVTLLAGAAESTSAVLPLADWTVH